MARIEAKCADRNDRQTNRPIGGCLLRPFHVHPARIATKKDISLRRFDHKTGPERPIAVSPPTAPPVVIAGNDDTKARPHVHALTPIQRDRLRACLQIGRASWRERVGQYVLISVIPVSLKKKTKNIPTQTT